MSIMMTPKPVRSTASRFIGFVLLLLILVLFFAFVYVILYHDAPPIPGTEKYFKNVDYDITSIGGGMLKKGIFIWTLTNKNDFAWPTAWIAYGENHGYLLGRVEAGDSAHFSNAILQNMTSKEFEAVPMLEADKVTIRLWIDFAEEDLWVIQLQKLIKFTKRHYSLGVWHLTTSP